MPLVQSEDHDALTTRIYLTLTGSVMYTINPLILRSPHLSKCVPLFQHLIPIPVACQSTPVCKNSTAHQIGAAILAHFSYAQNKHGIQYFIILPCTFAIETQPAMSIALTRCSFTLIAYSSNITCVRCKGTQMNMFINPNLIRRDK